MTSEELLRYMRDMLSARCGATVALSNEALLRVVAEAIVAHARELPTEPELPTQTRAYALARAVEIAMRALANIAEGATIAPKHEAFHALEKMKEALQCR